MKKKFESKDHYQILTNRIIERLEESLEYKTPWLSCDVLPFNPATGTIYKGINMLSLLAMKFNDPRFYTFNNVKQLSEESGIELRIKKGEHGAPIFKAMQRSIYETVGDEKEEVGRYWFSAHAGTVFNASQIDGLEPFMKKNDEAFEADDEIDKLASALASEEGVVIQHQETKSPRYVASTSSIVMPFKENFEDQSGYYGTLIGLLAQAVASKRKLGKRQDDDTDASFVSFSELVSDMAAYFIGARIKAPYSPEMNEARCAKMKTWIRDLEKDKTAIFKAASKANQVADALFEMKAKAFNEKTASEEAVEPNQTPRKLKI